MGYIHHHTRPCTHPDRRDSPPRTRHGGKRTAVPKGAMTSANAWIPSLVPVERSEWAGGDWSGMERPGGGWLGWDSVGEQSDLPRYRGLRDHLPPRAIHRAVDWIALGPQPGGQDDLSMEARRWAVPPVHTSPGRYFVHKQGAGRLGVELLSRWTFMLTQQRPVSTWRCRLAEEVRWGVRLWDVQYRLCP